MKFYFQCPQCQQDETFHSVAERDGGLGCVLLFFGGLLPFLLFQSGRYRRVQCGKCRLIFSQPPIRYTATARVAVVLMCLIAAVPLYLFYIQNLPDYDLHLPANGWVLFFEQIVRDHPRAVVYSVGGVLAITFVALFFVAVGSNYAKRANLKKHFKLAPDDQPIVTTPADPGSGPAPREP